MALLGREMGGARNGDLFTLTVDFSCSAIPLNGTIFDAVGVDYPNGSWTRETMAAAGTELTQDGYGVPDHWGHLPSRGAAMGSNMYARRNGGSGLNAGYTGCLLAVSLCCQSPC